MLYATREDLKVEIRECHSMIREVAGDLGGDIKTLHEQMLELQEIFHNLENTLKQIDEQVKILSNE